ncbi:MAG: hypothetical protein R6U44_00570 [Archaeoglobaceae archaeon]
MVTKVSMSEQSYQLKDIINSLSRAKGLELFKSLREPKTWTELENIAGGDKNSVNKRVSEFITFNLVQPTLLDKTPKGSKGYVLTPLGLQVLEDLEKIEKALEEQPEVEGREVVFR